MIPPTRCRSFSLGRVSGRGHLGDLHPREGQAPCPRHLIETTARPFLPHPRHRSRSLRSSTFAAGLRPSPSRASSVNNAA